MLITGKVFKAFDNYKAEYEKKFGKMPEDVEKTMKDAFRVVAEEQRNVNKALHNIEAFDAAALDAAFGPVKDNYEKKIQEMSEKTLEIKDSVKEVEQSWKLFQATITDRTSIKEIEQGYSSFMGSVIEGFENVKVSVGADLDEIHEKLQELPKSKEELKELEEYLKAIGKTGKEQFGAWLSAAENALSGIRGRLIQIQQELTNLATNTEDTIRGIYAQGEQTLRQIRRKGLDKSQLEAESKQFIRETAERARALAEEGEKEGDVRKLEEARDLYKQIEQEAGQIKDIMFAQDAAALAINSRAGIAASLGEVKKQKLEEEKKMLQEQEATYKEIVATMKELLVNLAQTINLDIDMTKAKEDIKGPHEAKIEPNTQGLREKIQNVLQAPFGITVQPMMVGGTAGNPLVEPGLASGGKLPGYGGGDRIPALLEAGEYVIRKEAVRKYGSNLFAALNALQGRIAKAATGGLIPRFASGGFFSDMSLDAIKKRLELFDQYSQRVLEGFNQPRLAPGDLGYGNKAYMMAAQSGLDTARRQEFGNLYEREDSMQGATERSQFQSAQDIGQSEQPNEPIEIKITVNTDGGGQISGSVKRY